MSPVSFEGCHSITIFGVPTTHYHSYYLTATYTLICFGQGRAEQSCSFCHQEESQVRVRMKPNEYYFNINILCNNTTYHWAFQDKYTIFLFILLGVCANDLMREAFNIKWIDKTTLWYKEDQDIHIAFCHSPTQPQHELVLMGRNPPTPPHPPTGTFKAIPGNLGSWLSVCNLILT